MQPLVPAANTPTCKIKQTNAQIGTPAMLSPDDHTQVVATSDAVTRRSYTSSRNQWLSLDDHTLEVATSDAVTR